MPESCRMSELAGPSHSGLFLACSALAAVALHVAGHSLHSNVERNCLIPRGYRVDNKQNTQRAQDALALLTEAFGTHLHIFTQMTSASERREPIKTPELKVHWNMELGLGPPKGRKGRGVWGFAGGKQAPPPVPACLRLSSSSGEGPAGPK
ncbi:hypothetical protein B0T25DRAFT_319029 [Lasiosphaeria hispida]|uniref:Uncharacterized protein n=1 Tax=Lasiosphaeria hispida TaxID=260671 RepID=A0AAJ0H9C6_9PEZI|nr:hypothetical protein B0T25DRAFT_319029 [Lasiosphaeria hispida]